MKDFFNRELEIGNFVFYAFGAGIAFYRIGQIAEINEKKNQFKVHFYEKDYKSGKYKLKSRISIPHYSKACLILSKEQLDFFVDNLMEESIDKSK